MRIRRVDPRLHEFGDALRDALHLAVDSVEPGADGLDQIRAKIGGRQAARRRVRRPGAAAPGSGRPWWRGLLPPPGWLAASVGAAAERFRPDPNRAGWFGWLRPAAAIATGLFVVTAASWAVAALPAAVTPSSNPRTLSSSTRAPKHHRTATSSFPSSSGVGGSLPGPGGQPAPSATPSCTTNPASPSGSPTGTPTTSSGSPSPSGSPTTTPSTTPSSASPSAGQTTPKQDGLEDDGGPPPSATPAPSVSPTPSGPGSPTPSSSPSQPTPCAS